MPSETTIFELYNKQVLGKFYKGKHQYFVKIPKGIVELKDRIIEFPNERKDWTKVKSVTQVTKNAYWKPELFAWGIRITAESFIKNLIIGTKLTKENLDLALKQAKQATYIEMTKGGNVGEEAHKWIHLYVQSKLNKTKEPKLPTQKETRNVIIEFLNWVEKHKITFVISELIVYNPIYDIAGTLDLIYKEKGEVGIADPKTANNIYDEFYMQLSFYRETYKLMTGIYPTKACLLWLPKNPKDNVGFTPYTEKINHEQDLGAFEAALYIDRWLNRE